MGNRSDKIPHKEVQFLNAVTIFQKGEITLKQQIIDIILSFAPMCHNF